MNITSQDGRPDAEVSIRVRGGGSISQSNEPLILVDGIAVGSLSDIPSDQVESIDVLKDASSTAIYGARGANGVILVTTKRGKKGAPKFNLNVNAGFSAPTRIIEMASSGLYAELMNEANVVNGDNPTYTPEEVAKFYAGTDPRYPNTNWRKETLKSISPKI